MASAFLDPKQAFHCCSSQRSDCWTCWYHACLRLHRFSSKVHIISDLSLIIIISHSILLFSIIVGLILGAGSYFSVWLLKHKLRQVSRVSLSFIILRSDRLTGSIPQDWWCFRCQLCPWCDWSHRSIVHSCVVRWCLLLHRLIEILSLTGSIAIGFCSQKKLNPNGDDGLIYGNAWLLGMQVLIILTVKVLPAGLTEGFFTVSRSASCGCLCCCGYLHYRICYWQNFWP